MTRYDASADLEDIFDTQGDATGGTGTAVANRADAILDGPSPADTIDSVMRLADRLPSLDDVREVSEDDTSALTDTEQDQKRRTEEVIQNAIATGNASVWVIAQGLERAAKGKWWRGSHSTFGEYVTELTGRSAVYGRQLRLGAPLALETAEKTGAWPNPGQVKETRRTEKAYGTEAAVMLFGAVRDALAVLGESPTAANLRAVHEQLPPSLPEVPEQQRHVIEETARRTLGLEESAAIAALEFESESNNGAAIAAPRSLERDAESAPPHADREQKTKTPSVITETEAARSPAERTPSDASPPTSDGDVETTGGTTEETDTQGAGGGSEAEASDEEVTDAEIVPDHLATLKDALKKLNAIDSTLTKEVWAQAGSELEESAEYAKTREKILKRATAIRNKALHAPTP